MSKKAKGYISPAVSQGQRENLPINPDKIRFFRRHLLSWFREKGRHFSWRQESNPYQILTAELLLQRTRASVVNEFFTGFLNKYPTWQDLASTEQSDLEIFLKPVGLWKRRAAALISLAQAVVNNGDKLPDTREELESLPAVGQYIANAALTMCFNKREPLLDVNMARLIERFFGPRKLADIRYDRYLQELSRKILSRGPAKELNWSMLDLAAVVCRARNPVHNNCPLTVECFFYKGLVNDVNRK